MNFKVGETVKITGLRNPLFATREGETGRITLPPGPFGHVVKKHGAVGTIVAISEYPHDSVYHVRFLCPEHFNETGESTRGGFVNLLLELDDECVTKL